MVIVLYHRSAPLRLSPRLHASRCPAIQLNDLFVTTIRSASRRRSIQRIAPQFNSTLPFVCYSAALRPSAPCYSPRLGSWHLPTPRRSATQRYHLFVTSQRTPHHNASFRDTAPHPTAPLNFVRHAASKLPFGAVMVATI